MAGLLTPQRQTAGNGLLDQAPRRVDDRVAGLLGLDPSIQRGAILPFGRDASGEMVMAWPEMAIDTLKSLMLPGHVVQGGEFTPRDVTEMALDMGMLSTVAPAPAGAKRMFGGINAKNADLPMDEASRMAPPLKKWFGDSKVVDENGGPMVVYHGTASDFDTFAADAPSKHIPLPGFFFTPDPEKASWFASSAGRDGLWRDADGNIEGAAGANVMPVYLSIKNPVDVDLSAPMRWNDTPRSVIADVEKILQEAKRQGHDGAILRGWADGSGKVQYVAFKPEQIKSAIGNRGTYDPDDPSIIASYLGIPGAGLLPSATEDDRRGLLND
jgi:hypothetical protein